jgi:hypothetical protein
MDVPSTFDSAIRYSVPRYQRSTFDRAVARLLTVPRLADFLAHTTKTGHSMYGIHLGVKEPHRRQFTHSTYRHC